MSDLISRKAAIEALSTPHGILYPIRTIEELPSVQPQIRGNAVNLCETCKYDFPECPKDSNVIFGDGKGRDNVCACSAYEVYVPPISKREWYQKGYEAGVKSVQPQRMRGKWIDGYLNEYHTARIATCSCCGYDGVPAVKEYNFCPNCGAWMEGQDETRGVSETP